MKQQDLKAAALDEFLAWLDHFGRVAQSGDASAFAQLFIADGYWRDMLSFTWEHRTFTGRSEIAEAFDLTRERTRMRALRLAPDRSPPQFIRRSGRDVIEAYFEFETEVGTGVGFVRLLQTESGAPPVWLMLTTLHSVRGHEDQAGANRPTGDEFAKIESPVSWGQLRHQAQAFEDRDPQVVIVGAGQGGLMLAARLRQMGVDALIVESQQKVGDGWRQRYNNLTLHNEIDANHFPYIKFPETWPRWIPKDLLGDWLESYAKLLELNVWTASGLTHAVHDPARQVWDLEITRADGSTRKMKPPHLVIATGVSGGAPKRPKLPGLESFAGKVIHSSEFKTGAEWAGKRAIVLGTGNSGHDVAQDLHVSGASVRLVQRGATCVVSLDPSALSIYSIFTEGRTVEDTDLMAASIPFPVLKGTYEWVTKLTSKNDAAMLERLKGAGFKTYQGRDDTGFQFLYLRGAGGYYIDVGCCDLITENKIVLAQWENAECFVPEGLKLKNGDIVGADLLVMATGFEGMERSIRSLLGDTIADRLGPVWGFDEDGVMRNMWRRTAQDGLWLMGGAITEARLNSRFLAVELRAALDGLLPERSALPFVPRRSPVRDGQ